MLWAVESTIGIVLSNLLIVIQSHLFFVDSMVPVVQRIAESGHLGRVLSAWASLKLNIALRHAGRATYRSADPKSPGIFAI